MKNFFFTLLMITTSMIAFADDHKEKKDVDMKTIKSGLGYWETKDCKEVSNAAYCFTFLIKA